MFKTREREQQPVEQDQQLAPFPATIRCDQCRAQAYVKAESDELKTELMFCIHHYRAHEIGLISRGFFIDDRSWALSP